MALVDLALIRIDLGRIYSQVCRNVTLFCNLLNFLYNTLQTTQSSFLSVLHHSQWCWECLLFVQRLSTTVKMVSKGVLKDHLILVSNSMTCTGNLIGFNTSGYKATFRSLKVQVPFTESTLFVSLYLKYHAHIPLNNICLLWSHIAYFFLKTPMKCFEKAAEKCDSDSLGCVVSSCSWGKHAAIGTGSSFQILWNENQVC